MPSASCSDNSNNYTENSVSNSNTTDCSCAPTDCGTTAGAASCRCRLAVTVDNDFVPCTFKPDYFDVTVTNRSGDLVASGKVAGGSSIILTMPSEGEYAVTVTGDACASPRAQTRRVRCCCGQPNGVSFIFMKLDECMHKPPHHHHCGCPPVPRPPMPPCPHEPMRPTCPPEPMRPPCPPEPPKPPCPPHHHPGGGIEPHDVILISEGPLEDYQ